jgi:hypothetical protein
MDKLSIENKSIEFLAIEKHKYPRSIQVFWVCIIFAFLSVVPSFLLNELPFHCELSQKVSDAQKFFLSQNYDQAVKLYTEILDKYPDFREARMHAIKSCFALSSQDVNLYFKGIDFLGDEKYKKSETSEINKFLPLKYQKHFQSLFQAKPSK